MKSFFKKIVVSILRLEARVVLWRFRPRVVGITGSVGKTTTKDAIATILEASYSVKKSHKSFNSEFGVPLTILGLDTAWESVWGWVWNVVRGLWVAFGIHGYPKWLVLEMGVDHPGDMQQLVRWVKLDVAVITLVAETPVHVEFFSSPRAVFEEKSVILEALKPNGVAILGYDDEKVRELGETIKNRVYTFGHDADADVHGDYYAIEYDAVGNVEGVSFKVMFDGNVVPTRLHDVVGRHIMYPVLAALAVGLSQEESAVVMTGALASFETPPGRMRLLSGKRGSVIIDDTYNASPVAVEQALETLKEIRVRGRKIAVLGDMMELGKHSEEAHRFVGERVAGVVEMLVCVGPRARGIAESARANGLPTVSVYDNAHQAGAYLATVVAEGDVVLMKGSQSVRLERAVEQVLAEHERKEELLVRQGKAWAIR